jgi:nucleotide-binding universal stress UspA family protein
MKSILLHVQDDDSLDQRLQTALSLARASGGHLSCIHVTPIEAYAAFATFGGVFVMQGVMSALDEHESDLRRRLEDHLQKEDVSWDYQQVTGGISSNIIWHAALADVIVTGREHHHQSQPVAPVSLLGDLLHRSRTPLIIPASDGKLIDPNGVAMIAWDGSYEAANAVRGAVGLLRLSSKVEIIQIEEAPQPALPSTRLLEYLSRQDIHAHLRVETAEKEMVPVALESCAEQAGASYLVMGGYSRTRIGEYLFGGVTRSLLKQSSINLMIAH